MATLSRGFQRINRLGIVTQKRFVFGFNSTPSAPEGLEDYELLYSEHDKHSDNARNFLRRSGYLDLISLRNIDEYPLDMNELRELRYKLNLPFEIWVIPPVLEDGRKPVSQRIEEAVIKIVNGYKPRNQKKQSLHSRLSAEADEYHIDTPIFHSKKEQRAIIAKPAEKLITIIKPPKKQLDKAQYGEEGKRYQVFGSEWHKKGGRYYDDDDGMDWDHVKFENFAKDQEKKFKHMHMDEWRDSEIEYCDQNVKDDPNDMDGFIYRRPK